MNTGILKFFKIELWLLAVLAGVYLYLISSTVFAAANRQKILEEVGRQRAEVVTLESRYFDQSNQITIDLAYTLGFEDATDKTSFAAARPLVAYDVH